MRVVAEAGRREPVAATLVVLATAAVASTVVLGHGSKVVAPADVLVMLLAVAHEKLLAWRSLLSLIILTILFVPIKRYTLPASLPFNLELYRLFVALVVVIWLTALLIDPRVRLRASGLDAPLLFFLLAIGLSIVVNNAQVGRLESSVVKSVTFFLSFVFVYYLIVSLARRATDIDFLVRLLAGGGAVLGALAIYEQATGFNVFDHLKTVMPFLNFDSNQLPHLSRYGALRVYGSAQHPIAFGTALAVLLPLAIYRARAFNQKRWWLAAFLILLGELATRSRTGVLMLLAVALVYVFLRPQSMKRLWPAVVPALIVIHLALPGALGSIKGSFFPKGGIVAEQQNAAVGSGRLATAGPAIDAEFKPNPILGEGFCTRITGDPKNPDPGAPPANAPILDDGWLGVLLETGSFGAFCLAWLFLRAARRMGGAAKRDLSPRGWLLVATTASIVGFGVGMFTYDAFSFIQVTLLLFIVLALGAAALLSPPEEWERLKSRG